MARWPMAALLSSVAPIGLTYDICIWVASICVTSPVCIFIVYPPHTSIINYATQLGNGNTHLHCLIE